MGLRSDEIKKGIERTPNRALFYATGISKSSLKNLSLVLPPVSVMWFPDILI